MKNLFEKKKRKKDSLSLEHQRLMMQTGHQSSEYINNILEE